jgi:hypothetical protein
VQSGYVFELQVRGAQPARQFGRADELRVAMRAAWQQAHHVLGADDRERERLRRAIERRDEQASARHEQGGAGAQHRGRIGHVFEHLHAGDHVEARGLRGRERFGADLAIVHREAGFEQVQPRDLEQGWGKIDRGDLRALARQRLRQQSAAAADVERARAAQRGPLADVGQAYRIQVVQRTRIAVRIPPARSECSELLDLGRVDVDLRGAHRAARGSAAIRSRQWRAFASSACGSVSASSPPVTRATPSIQTSQTWCLPVA